MESERWCPGLSVCRAIVVFFWLGAWTLGCNQRPPAVTDASAATQAVVTQSFTLADLAAGQVRTGQVVGKPIGAMFSKDGGGVLIGQQGFRAQGFLAEWFSVADLQPTAGDVLRLVTCPREARAALSARLANANRPARAS